MENVFLLLTANIDLKMPLNNEKAVRKNTSLIKMS
jgi:hypothetical protein